MKSDGMTWHCKKVSKTRQMAAFTCEGGTQAYRACTVVEVALWGIRCMGLLRLD